MKIFAIGAVLALVLLSAVAAVAADGVTTEAARPPDLIAEPAQGMRVLAGGCPNPAGMSDELKRLLGSEAYPGAPTAADLGYTGPRCEIDCGACDWSEYEPLCEDEWVDTWNGGCNSVPEVFYDLTASYGLITLCGTSGNYLFGGAGYRDTDWYEIQLSEATEITFCCTAEFPLVIFLIDGTAGCGSLVTVDYTSVDACTEACIQQTVGPGTFWLWVGPSVFSGVPCGEEYRMTVEGYEAADCVADCPFGAVRENEDACYPEYVDAWNGGCNSFPYVFQPLEPSAGTITVCGESGVYPYAGDCWRDTDWYEISLDEQRPIEVCAFAEFPLQLLILGGECETGSVMLNGAYAAPCELACMSDTLDAGRYWLWVGSSTWSPVDCGSRYTMTVSGYTTPVERTSWGTIKALYR